MNQDLDDVTNDRTALEAVLGHSLEKDGWPADALAPGTRVRVIQDPEWGGPWREVFAGTVDRTMPPQPVRNLRSQPGELEYSVAFDEPQHDIDGSGPYRKAVIWDRYLEVI
jgi:hypothetical protein